MPVLIPTFTEDKRQELRLKGRRSLYFFGVGILGFDCFAPHLKRSILAPMHYELACFLEGRAPYRPWRQALVAAFRDGGKSIWTSMVYPWWRSLHIDSFTVRLIENTDTNAFDNHYWPMAQLFMESRRASFLQWLYQEEIPQNFEGCNTEHWNWRKTRPEVGHSITYLGLAAKWEGSRGDLLVGDDLEGADANRSDVPGQAAWDGYQRMLPLRREPAHSQILLVGTPHGRQPFVWRIRRMEAGGTLDNSKRHIQIFWQPLLDEAESYESCAWKDRFPPDEVEFLQKADIWDQQYMLRERSSSVEFFTMQLVREGCYKRDSLEPNILEYDSYEFDPDNMDEIGMTRPKIVRAAVNLRNLRYFLHVDFVHKSDDLKRHSFTKPRDSNAAQVVVGVAEDFHAFVVKIWKKEGLSLEQQAVQAFYLYRYYACHLVTAEYVGAQAWFRSFIEALEKRSKEWRYPTTIGPLFAANGKGFELPLMSSRTIGAEKSNQSKEYLWRERLSPWLNYKLLHLNEREHGGLFHEMENCASEQVSVDLLDALSQGPGRIPSEQGDGKRIRPDAGKMVWSCPLPREYMEHMGRRRKMTEILLDKISGWSPIWGGGAPG